jgi:hypothetical protein
MKKIYLIVFSITISLLSYGQTPIVTIDRDNIVGPTTTGTEANISALGLTRGAGIASSNGADFSTKNWNAATLLEAQNLNEYVQWSVSANANIDIDISSIDIRLLRNNNGPQDWQIFYSSDDFVSISTPLGTPQTATTAEINYNINSLLINSGDGGTVTFRLYAWNANNNGGTFSIAGDPTWSNFGVIDPGARVLGTINTTPLNSAESNIVITGFSPVDNINYLAYNVASGLSTSNAIKIGEFSIQDGGDNAPDADLLPTILTGITFDVTGFSNILALAIFDSATNVSESTTVTSSTTFSGINSGVGISAPNDGTKTFSIYATFNTTVTDNDQLQLVINNAEANGIIGSSFETSDAGGASTPIVGDDNRIEVTATRLNFSVQPSDVSTFSIMAPAPIVLANDNNSNLDLDHTGTIVLSPTSSVFDPGATITVNAVAGVATFDNIIFSSASVDVILIAVSENGLNLDFSDSFEVFGYFITIASQDFDGSTPDWPYSSDVAFFDNGWGIDGYYGIINSSLATPLDFASFSENILGSNDLDDEGNGTSGLATVTFETIDIAGYNNVSLSFDYDIAGYGANDDAQYEVFFDGTSQGVVDLINGGGSVSIAIPDTVNQIGLQVSIGNSANGDNAFIGFDNFLISSVFDGLIYFSNAWTPSAPTNGTGSLNALILDGTYSITTDVAINNVIVTEAANVIVEKGRSIQVNGGLVCNNNVLLDSDSLEYSSLIVEGNVTGNVTYNRHVNTNASSGGNDLISAPITGQTFGDFATANTNIVSNPSNPTEKLFGPFEKVIGSYLTYDTNIPAEAAITLDPGIGYRAASTDGLNFSFTGTVNTSIVDVPIVISGANNAEWNLIGNPYPSYIMLSDFLGTNNTSFDPISSGIYGYDGNASDGWEIWNQAYSEANPDAVVTPGQGFLVASGSASETISFTPGMRSVGTSDDFIPGRVMNSSISNLELTLTNEDNSYKTDFYFTENASLGLDPGYDSQTFGGIAPEFSIYSHLVAENSGISMAIQSVSNSDLSNVTIPIGINSLQGEQVSVSISNSTLPVSIEVYLEDNVTNTITLLNDNNYQFTPSSNINGTGRFFLRFTDASLTVDELTLNNLQIYATLTPKTLFIKGLLNSNTSVKIYDLQSRLVLTTNLNTSSDSNQVDLSKLVSGVYMVSISNNAMTKTQKIVVK